MSEDFDARLPCIALDIKEFSDVWNHDRHFLIIGKNVVKLWGNAVIREFGRGGDPTGRVILCAISYIDEGSLGISDDRVVVSIEILHTSSEYCNHYGNCSVVAQKSPPRNKDADVINGYIITEKELTRLFWEDPEASILKTIRSRPAPSSPECIACPKPAIGYGIGKDEARLTQCNTCMFDGKRECMYHGYPDETIPPSCEYKIGKHAVIAPIEAQMHNREHDAEIRNAAKQEETEKLKVRLKILLQSIKKKEFKPYMTHPRKAVWFEDIENIIKEEFARIKGEQP